MADCNKSLVSVIVPHYNRCDLLEAIVQSVAGQTYRPIELIIIDDGSQSPPENLPDSLLGINIRLLKRKHCGKPGLVRNVGIRAANGKYIAFLDSDDLWFPEKLQNQVEILESDSSVDLVHGNAVSSTEEKKELYIDATLDSMALSYIGLLKRNYILTSSVVARRELFTTEEFLGLRSAQDYEMWLRLGKNHKFTYLPEPLFQYSAQREDSVSRKGVQRYLCLLRIFRDELKMSSSVKIDKVISSRISGFYLKLAKWAFLKGRKKRCRMLVLKSLKIVGTGHAYTALFLLLFAPSLLFYLYGRTKDF